MHRLARLASMAAVLLAPTLGARAQTTQPPPAQAAPATTPSKDFPKGTATPSAECGACHQAIYGPRPDDRAYLKEDEKRPDRIAATQADEQGPHEAPIRAGEERILTWQPELRDGSYTLEASLVYDLNRYNDRSFEDDQREISKLTLSLPVRAGH